MPQYYLNVRVSGTLLHDSTGLMLANLEAARMEAIASVREIVADRLMFGQSIDDGDALEIADEHGALLATVRFKDTLRLH